MLRTLDVALIVIMIAAAAVTYRIKQHAEQKTVAIRELHHRIAEEKDSIKLLKAEWSLLTEPSRLQKLVDLYHSELDLDPVEPTQFGSFRDLPERPVKVPDVKPTGNVADMPPDDVMTGSVRN
jgi:hypothetical protein